MSIGGSCTSEPSRETTKNVTRTSHAVGVNFEVVPKRMTVTGARTRTAGFWISAAPTSPGVVPIYLQLLCADPSHSESGDCEGNTGTDQRECDVTPRQANSADSASDNRFNPLRIFLGAQPNRRRHRICCGGNARHHECVTDKRLLERRGPAHAHDVGSDSLAVPYLPAHALRRSRRPSSWDVAGRRWLVPRCIRHVNPKVPLRLRAAGVGPSGSAIRPVPTSQSTLQSYADQVSAAAASKLGASIHQRSSAQGRNWRAQPEV